MTNRTAIISVAAIILLSGCDLMNTIRMKNANDHLVASWPKNQSEAKLETQYIGEKPYVVASINGGESLLFMVDTGASMSYLFDTPKVMSLGLERGYSLSASGWGDGKDSVIYQTKVEQLNLAGISFKQVNFAFMPVSKSQYFLRADEAIYDGVLGHDVLHHFSWTFDKASKQVSISSLPFAGNEKAYSFEFDTFLSKISVAGELNFGDEQVFVQDFIVDTGSRHSLKVATAFIENNDIVLSGTSIIAADFGLSGRTVHQRVTLPELRLGELSVAGIKTNLVGGDFEDDYAVLGSAFLNKYISIVDYHSSRLHLIPYSNSSFITDYNLLGLELRKIRSQEFVVRYVFPQMISANFDFQEGDIIVSISGVQARDISQEQWLKLSATVGQYEICRMRKIIKCIKVTSKNIPGYSTPS
jgi:predicted aspartyl protease